MEYLECTAQVIIHAPQVSKKATRASIRLQVVLNAPLRHRDVSAGENCRTPHQGEPRTWCTTGPTYSSIELYVIAKISKQALRSGCCYAWSSSSVLRAAEPAQCTGQQGCSRIIYWRQNKSMIYHITSSAHETCARLHYADATGWLGELTTPHCALGANSLARVSTNVIICILKRYMHPCHQVNMIDNS